MIYVFKDGVLLRELSLTGYWGIMEVNDYHPKNFPTDSISYNSTDRKWYVKRTRKNPRPLPEGMIPKEWKTMLLLLGVPQ